MKNTVKITADSTCDLSPQLLTRHEISIAPLYVHLGEDTRKDGFDVRTQELFSYYEKYNKLPKTAAVSVADYAQLWSPYVAMGKEIVHVDISSEFSSCYQNALLAAQHVGHVHVVDSRNLSTGQGHIVMLAAELAQQGLAAGEIAQRCRQATQRVEASFVVDTATYLYKGGRCSALAAASAGVFRVKPCIEVQGGSMGVGKKYRGNLPKVLARYVEDRLKGRTDLDLARIFITHTVQDRDIIAAVEQQVRALQPFEEVLETHAGCTVACHCGPGTLGVLFFRK